MKLYDRVELRESFESFHDSLIRGTKGVIVKVHEGFGIGNFEVEFFTEDNKTISVETVNGNFLTLINTPMPKYSKDKFDGYTHRFKVELFTNDNSYTVDIYSDSGDYNALSTFISLNKKHGLTDWKIFHRATKAQDELSSVLIDEVLNNL